MVAKIDHLLVWFCTLFEGDAGNPIRLNGDGTKTQVFYNVSVRNTYCDKLNILATDFPSLWAALSNDHFRVQLREGTNTLTASDFPECSGDPDQTVADLFTDYPSVEWTPRDSGSPRLTRRVSNAQVLYNRDAKGVLRVQLSVVPGSISAVWVAPAF